MAMYSTGQHGVKHVMFALASGTWRCGAAFKMKISWDGGVVIMRENAP